MKALPRSMPEHQIEPSQEAPFSVKWGELPGWFIVPRQGQRLNRAVYDCPGKTMSEQYQMKVTGKVRIHGIEGVEITAAETSTKPGTERVFAAQLTDTIPIAAFWLRATMNVGRGISTLFWTQTNFCRDEASERIIWGRKQI